MAEVKRKLRIITEKSANKDCVHNFKKDQVVFTEDSENDNLVIHAYDSIKSQHILPHDYEEVKPVSVGDKVVTKSILTSSFTGDELAANSILKIATIISDNFYLARSSDSDTFIVYRSEFFALCDRVFQREDSEFAELEDDKEGITKNNNQNPIGMGGSIFEIRTNVDPTQLSIRVKWDNGQVNSYRSDNLEFEDNSEYGERPINPVIDEKKEEKVQKYLPNINDTVKISNKSEYFNKDTKGNPKCKGVVIDNNYPASEYKYHVKWENNETNIYRAEDLVVLKRAK